MTIEQFEKELQQLHRDFSILPSRFEGLAGVHLRGIYLFAIPAHNIYDNARQGYGMDGIDGKWHRHRTRTEALIMAKAMLHKFINDSDWHDAATGEGKYSDKELEIGKHTPTSRPAGLILPT